MQYKNLSFFKKIDVILVSSNIDYERYLKGELNDEEILSYFN